MEEKEKIVSTPEIPEADRVPHEEKIEQPAPDANETAVTAQSEPAPDADALTQAESPAQSAVSAETTAQADGGAAAATPTTETTADTHTCPKKEKGLRAWWARHKPSKRRFIQIYSFLLYNAYIRGFVKGDIFKGITKTACVPGLNCYSCPGAVAACPLGALQNALTGTGHGGAYYMFGIILLYGLIFGRTICGFLCPVGLGQDLLYKVKTPKLKKSKVTRVLSYFKYVILAMLVIGIPTIYAIDKTAVPGFCKYICPAGTLEGAIMLLIHPNNDSLYGMLGALFSWKTAVLVCIFTASIFIYRVFCRFLCPLGAIYGLFNRFALLGVKVDRSKCTHCGKCVDKCKMDVKSVGDHECINCGECMSACPTKAIRWKGSKVFLDNVDKSIIATPTATVTEPAPTEIEKSGRVVSDAAFAATATAAAAVGKETAAACTVGGKQKTAKKFGRAFWLKALCIFLAAALFFGVFTYVNFFAAEEEKGVDYLFAVDSEDGSAGIVSFTVGGSDKSVTVSGDGDGTREKPFEVSTVKGKWEVPTGGMGATYFKFNAKKKVSYSVDGENYSIKIYYMTAGKAYSLYDSAVDGNRFTLSLEAPEGFGNSVGDICYDFTLKGYNGVDKVTLYDFRGRVTVVNFWGTWCGPCVKELPDFEAVRSKHPDVAVIAIHSVYMSETAQQFLNEKKWNEWGVIFAQDTGTKQKSDVFTLLGGKTNAYPRTLVLDADGVIRSAFDGEVSESKLENAIQQAAEAGQSK